MTRRKQVERDALSGLSVLIVEDVLLVAMELESVLRRFGCRVVGPVPRLDEATALVRDEKIDGAILDLNIRRSEEHTSELQSLMRISYAVFCLQKKNQTNNMYTCTVQYEIDLQT